ncbi:MAG: ABC transporter ATP-binding protein [Dehalococcoidia bacterium]|nr:ABC transporter ATP-binding protein [Dehalococcoidia bacterium]
MTTPESKNGRGSVTAVLRVHNLRTRFYTPAGVVKAVDGLSFELRRGECLCLVGESGCGKTAAALSVLRLIDAPPGHIEDGRVIFDGQDLLGASQRELRRIRGNRIAMIFQDAQSALNPVFSVGDQIAEAIRYHLGTDDKTARDRAIDLMKRLGIPSAETRSKDYPHQFSGGMQQRVMIAMALSCDPEILIADEPTTAVDVTIKAQILDIFKELKETRQLSLIFITHDLGVVAEIADRVIIMYGGRMAEAGTVFDIFDNPKHPYTVGLLNCLPDLTGAKDRLAPIPGNIPDLIDPPETCIFQPRCPKAMTTCREKPAPAIEVSFGHTVFCHLYNSPALS